MFQQKERKIPKTWEDSDSEAKKKSNTDEPGESTHTCCSRQQRRQHGEMKGLQFVKCNSGIQGVNEIFQNNIIQSTVQNWLINIIPIDSVKCSMFTEVRPITQIASDQVMRNILKLILGLLILNYIIRTNVVQTK